MLPSKRSGTARASAVTRGRSGPSCGACGAILEELSGYSLDGMDPAQRNLFCLAAAFAEAAPHHELYGGSAAVPHSFSAHRFAPRHGAKESWAASFDR